MGNCGGDVESAHRIVFPVVGRDGTEAKLHFLLTFSYLLFLYFKESPQRRARRMERSQIVLRRDGAASLVSGNTPFIAVPHLLDVGLSAAKQSNVSSEIHPVHPSEKKKKREKIVRNKPLRLLSRTISYGLYTFFPCL